MHARVTRSRVAQTNVDDAVRIVDGSIVPAAKEQAGFRGLLHLVDPGKGEGITISLWGSEDDMRAGESGPYYREQIAKVRPLLAGEPETGAFEVAVYEA